MPPPPPDHRRDIHRVSLRALLNPVVAPETCLSSDPTMAPTGSSTSCTTDVTSLLADLAAIGYAGVPNSRLRSQVSVDISGPDWSSIEEPASLAESFERGEPESQELTAERSTKVQLAIDDISQCVKAFIWCEVVGNKNLNLRINDAPYSETFVDKFNISAPAAPRFFDIPTDRWKPWVVQSTELTRSYLQTVAKQPSGADTLLKIHRNILFSEEDYQPPSDCWIDASTTVDKEQQTALKLAFNLPSDDDPSETTRQVFAATLTHQNKVPIHDFTKAFQYKIPGSDSLHDLQQMRDFLSRTQSHLPSNWLLAGTQFYTPSHGQKGAEDSERQAGLDAISWAPPYIVHAVIKKLSESQALAIQGPFDVATLTGCFLPLKRGLQEREFSLPTSPNNNNSDWDKMQEVHEKWEVEERASHWAQQLETLRETMQLDSS